MKYFLKRSSLMTALTLLFNLPCSAMEENNEPIHQPRKLALYNDSKSSSNPKPFDKTVNRYMHRFSIKCGGETEIEAFKKNNIRQNDGFERGAPLDTVVKHLLNNQFRYLVDKSANRQEYVLVLENIDMTDLKILMRLVKPLMHDNPLYVQYVPRNSFEVAVKNVFEEIGDEVSEERDKAIEEGKKDGFVVNEELDLSPVNVNEDKRDDQRVIDPDEE